MRVYDAHYTYGIYQEQQFRFLEALPENIKKELTVRLSVGWCNYNWSADKRWNDRIPSVLIEKRDAPLRTLLSRNRLVVHSYDSTGILEGILQRAELRIPLGTQMFSHIYGHHAMCHETFSEVGVIVVEGSLCFCLEQPSIDKVLVGCESIEQLRALVDATNKPHECAVVVEIFL